MIKDKKAKEACNKIFGILNDMEDISFWEAFGILEAVRCRIQDKA